MRALSALLLLFCIELPYGVLLSACRVTVLTGFGGAALASSLYRVELGCEREARCLFFELLLASPPHT
jgi:hypothetical protein